MCVIKSTAAILAISKLRKQYDAAKKTRTIRKCGLKRDHILGYFMTSQPSKLSTAF